VRILADTADGCLRYGGSAILGGVSEIDVTYFNDPACPWGYSISPALAVLRWRYGSQLHWRLVWRPV
jgi:hypothetical protein